MSLRQHLKRIQPAVNRHLLAQNAAPYEAILKYALAKEDVWITTQGEYIAWWCAREGATLHVVVEDEQIQVTTSLTQGVIEKVPGEFLETNRLPCPNTSFSGEVWITIDPALRHKDLLIEILKREGILNFCLETEGPFWLSEPQIGPLLEEIAGRVKQRRGRFIEEDVCAVRQCIAAELARYNLPLLRLWYHPQVNGMVPQAVMSVRYDVDRAITNIKRIRALEAKYRVDSTLYVRAFCPFYSDVEIKQLGQLVGDAEIALHGEFNTHARRFGGEPAAAVAERRHLENLVGRPVQGVGMHGGELSNNRSDQTDRAVEQAGLLYDSTARPGEVNYFFPFRKQTGDLFGQSYQFPHALADVEIPVSRHYSQMFYERAIARLEQVYSKNGIFILLMHPEYFGFFAYLFHLKNLRLLFSFLMTYFKRSQRTH